MFLNISEKFWRISRFTRPAVGYRAAADVGEFSVDTESAVPLSVDNTAARNLAYNPEHHERTKHIDRRHFYIRELVEEGRITVPFVKSADNLADFFTKPLAPAPYTALRDRVMGYA